MRFTLIVVISVLIALSLTCNHQSGLFVSRTNPPSFEIRRSRSAHVRIFPLLIVYELHPDNAKVGPLQEDLGKNKILWKIVADPTQSNHVAISEAIEKIEYGKVPAGFIQEIPSEGEPEAFQDNRIYEALGPLSLMGDAAVRFTLSDGKITPHPLPVSLN